LCRRYRKLTRARKPPTVVTAAIASELAGFVWAIAKQAQRHNPSAPDAEIALQYPRRSSSQKTHPKLGKAGGTVSADNASEQQQIIFDPIPRADGIEASADPLFEPRANIYLMSGRRRREAGKR
jgi:hypothetical protein